MFWEKTWGARRREGGGGEYRVKGKLVGNRDGVTLSPFPPLFRYQDGVKKGDRDGREWGM